MNPSCLLFRCCRPLLAVLLIVAQCVCLPAWAQTRPPLPSTLEIQGTEGTGPRLFRVAIPLVDGRAWRVERSLSVDGAWLTVGQGVAPAGIYSGYDFVTIKEMPAPPPSPAPPPAGPRSFYRTEWRFLAMEVQVRASDGCAVLRWYSPLSGGVVACVVPAGSGFDLRQGGSAPRWSTIMWTEPDAVAPGFDIVVTAGELAGEPPVGLPPLTGEDLMAKEAVLSQYQYLLTALWPPPGYVPPPPVKPNLDTRSFYQLRSLEKPVDSDGDGVPDAFETAWNPEDSGNDRIMLSEVCYSQITGTTAAGTYDWVELFNPTETALTTEGLYITDSAANPAKHALPVLPLAPGGRLVLFCSGLTAALVPPSQPPSNLSNPLYHLPFALSDEGETVRLYKKDEVPPGAVQTYTLCNALMKPAAGAWGSGPLSDVSYGWTVTPDGTGITQGFFAKPTPGAGNERWPLLGSLPEPLVLDVTVSEASTTPLAGCIFRNGMKRAKLQMPVTAPPGAVMVYTLDGSEPDGTSAIYQEPIEVRRTAVLRARAMARDWLPSHTVTRTFIHTPSVLADTAGRLAAGLGTADALQMAAQWGYTSPPARGTTLLSATDYSPLPGYSAPCILDQLESRPAVFISFKPPVDYTTERLASFELYLPPSGGQPAWYSQESIAIQRTGGSASANSGLKHSWDILFKKGATMAPEGDWQGPVAADGKSRLFPGSLVTKWKRLKLRNPGQASFPFSDPEGTGSYPRLYMNDAWLKETQRALGGNSAFITGQRRWAHVWVNGVFYGLYDLEEHHNADTISAHLTAAALAALPPSATAAERDAVRQANKAGNIQFLLPGDTGAPTTPGAEANFRSEVLDACLSVAQNRYPAYPGYQAAWDALSAHFDAQDYARYVTACEYVGKGDLAPDQVRMWRHPVDQKWRFIAWDGDSLYYQPLLDELRYLKAARTVKSSTFWQVVPLGLSEVAQQLIDQRPLEYLLGHPVFSQAFGSVLVPASDWYSTPAGCLTPPTATARFDAMAQDVRSTLEAEAMAWGTLAQLDKWTSTGSQIYNGQYMSTYGGIEQARRLVSLTNMGSNRIPYEIITVPVSTSNPFEVPTVSLYSVTIRAGRMGLLAWPPQ